MNLRDPRRWSGLQILVPILALTGCAGGGGGISVGTGLDVAEAEALPVAESAASLAVAADPLAELSAARADDLRLTASAGGEVSGFEVAGVAAAPVAERDVKRQVLERWPGGRVRVLRVIEAAERGPIASAETEIVLRYGSALTAPTTSTIRRRRRSVGPTPSFAPRSKVIGWRGFRTAGWSRADKRRDSPSRTAIPRLSTRPGTSRRPRRPARCRSNTGVNGVRGANPMSARCPVSRWGWRTAPSIVARS